MNDPLESEEERREGNVRKERERGKRSRESSPFSSFVFLSLSLSCKDQFYGIISLPPTSEKEWIMKREECSKSRKWIVEERETVGFGKEESLQLKATERRRGKEEQIK